MKEFEEKKLEKMAKKELLGVIQIQKNNNKILNERNISLYKDTLRYQEEIKELQSNMNEMKMYYEKMLKDCENEK